MAYPGLFVRSPHRANRPTVQHDVDAPADVCTSVLVAIVGAQGCIDANHAGRFADELERAIAAGASRLLVDLGEAVDVTTAGMNVLLAARQELIGRGGRIAVVLPARLRSRFRLLQLDRRFLIASDRLAAAALLGVASVPDRHDGRPAPYARAA